MTGNQGFLAYRRRPTVQGISVWSGVNGPSSPIDWPHRQARSLVSCVDRVFGFPATSASRDEPRAAVNRSSRADTHAADGLTESADSAMPGRGEIHWV